MKFARLFLSLLAAPALAQVRSMSRFELFTDAGCTARKEKIQGVPIKKPVVYIPAGACAANPFNIDGPAQFQFLKPVCPSASSAAGSYTTHANSDCGDAATSSASVQQGTCLSAVPNEVWARFSCEEVDNNPVGTYKTPARLQEYSDNSCNSASGDEKSLSAPACANIEGTFAIPKCLDRLTKDNAQVIFELFQDAGCATSSNLFVTGEMKTSSDATECLPMASNKAIKYLTNQADVCTAPTCTIQCTGKTCGPDGCGGTCGACSAGSRCNNAQTCETVPEGCSRNCADKNCGDDGCGSICGVCERTSTCAANVCVAPGSSSAMSSYAFARGSILAALLVSTVAL